MFIVYFYHQDPIHVWSGGLDGSLHGGDINSSTETVVGRHDDAIRFIIRLSSF